MHAERDTVMANLSVRLSVRLSVYLSVTLWYCIETNVHIVISFHLLVHDSSFLEQNFLPPLKIPRGAPSAGVLIARELGNPSNGTRYAHSYYETLIDWWR